MTKFFAQRLPIAKTIVFPSQLNKQNCSQRLLILLVPINAFHRLKKEHTKSTKKET